MDGFDTHAAQGATDGAHADCLSDYDNIVRSLKSSMSEEAFNNTLVLTLTEFGRTIKQNSSNGTEHGYGSAILMAGGLVKKAQVHTDWPGLKKKELFEGRDLNSLKNFGEKISFLSFFFEKIINFLFLQFRKFSIEIW